MTEVSDGQIQTTTLDHLGLVAAICQDLKIAQRIDNRLPSHSQRKVSPGRAVVAMILNGSMSVILHESLPSTDFIFA